MKPPAFFGPAILFLFCIIVLFPILFMVGAPFLGSGPSGDLGSLSALFEARQITLAGNSLGLGVGTSCFCLIIGVPLAVLIARTDLMGRRFFRMIYFIPILIPPYIHAIVWSHLNLYIKEMLSWDIHNLWGGIFVLTLAYFPFVTLMTVSGLKSIDRNLEEASLLRHGRLHTLRHITVPLVTPHILSGIIFVFIFSIIDFGVPDILRIKVYPVEVFVQFSAFYNEAAATVLSLPLIVVSFLLIALQKWHMKNRSYVQVSGGGYAKKMWYRLGGGITVLSLLFCFTVLGLSVVVPIGVLLKVAGPFKNYVRALHTSIGQIGYSLVLACAGAFLAMVMAFLLSCVYKKSKTPFKEVLEFTFFLPLAIPAVTLGIGLIKVWNQAVIDMVYNCSLIIVIGYVARFIPFSLIAVSSGLKQVNPHLEEAASLATSRWTRVVRKIIFPLLQPSLISAFFIVFVLSFGELGTTLLIIPPGRETIPIKIFNLMHYGAEQLVAALCLVLVAMVLVFSSVFMILHKRLTRRVSG